MAKLKEFKNEIKVLDIAALVQKANALKVEIDDLVLDKNMSKLKDLKSISKKKKNLARVMTVLNQKSMIAKLEAGKPEETKDTKESDVEKSEEGGKKK